MQVLNTSVALKLCFITFYHNEFYLMTDPYSFLVYKLNGDS